MEITLFILLNIVNFVAIFFSFIIYIFATRLKGDIINRYLFITMLLVGAFIYLWLNKPFTIQII